MVDVVAVAIVCGCFIVYGIFQMTGGIVGSGRHGRRKGSIRNYSYADMPKRPEYVDKLMQRAAQYDSEVQVLDSQKVPESTALDSILNPSRKYRFKETL